MTAARTSVSRMRLTCKWIQLILSCICVGLFANAPIDNVHSVESILLAVTFGGYIIVLVGIVIGFGCDERVPKKVDLFYTLLGMALFIAAGSVTITYFKNLKASKNSSPDIIKLVKTGIAAGTIALINAVMFLIDALLSYKDVNEYVPQD